MIPLSAQRRERSVPRLGSLVRGMPAYASCMVEVRGGRVRVSAELPPGLAAVGVWLAWAWSGGGYEPSWWGSLGAGLVVLLLIAGPVLSGDLDGYRMLAGAALLLFTAWNFLSLLWAQFPGLAWTGADKTAVYAAGFALLAFVR